MDKRATRSLTGGTGTVDAHTPVTAEAEARGGPPAIDSARTHDEADLQKVLQAIAARIDVVLDEKAVAGGEIELHSANQARSSVTEERATDATPALRSQALATTVLRMSADGRLDVDDRELGAVGDAALHAGLRATPHTAKEAGHDAADGSADGDVEDAADGTAEHHRASDRQPDVEDRLRAARERLVTRRASATAARVDESGPPDPRIHLPSWRRTDIRTLIQRLLIGLAIVAASAVVSILIA